MLTQFPFHTSKRGLNCYNQTVDTRVASRVIDQLRTKVLRKFGNFKT